MVGGITGDAVLTAAAGIITSIIIAGSAFYGVVYNARQQQRPRRVKVDPAELDRLEAELVHERRLRELAEAEAHNLRGALLGALSRPEPDDRPE